VGLGEDRLIVSAATLRVVARLTGSVVDQERRLSDGRVAVGRLIGSGESVPWLNASLNTLGTSVCTPERPSCGACPLREECVSARPVEGDDRR